MGEDAKRFRVRAKQCRELAKIARDEQSHKTLSEMANELETEADALEKANANER